MWTFAHYACRLLVGIAKEKTITYCLVITEERSKIHL